MLDGNRFKKGNFVSLRRLLDFTSLHGKSRGLLIMLDAIEKFIKFKKTDMHG